MTINILQLSKDLIKIKTDPSNKKALEIALKLVKAKLKGFTIEEFNKNGTKSILVYNSKTRPKKFKVILNGHLDVIPGKAEQYFPKIKGNKLYGVGAMDMKSNVACLMASFVDCASKVNYPLALQIVTDEEIGGFEGTKYQVDKGVRADFVIAGETTNFNIVNKAKGIMWLKISHKGKTAHGAYPWRGENSLIELNKFLEKLFIKIKNPSLAKWVNTINVAKIETSNETFNKIPDNACVWLDVRYLPSEDKKILGIIKKLLPKNAKLEVVAHECELNVLESNFFLKKLKLSTEKVMKKKIVFYGAQGSSDARHYTKIGCAGVEFGPIGGGIGTDIEWVDIKSLEKYRLVLNDFLLSLN